MPSVQIDSDSLNAPALNLINGSGDPTAPGSGHAKLYVKSGGVYVLLDTGPAVALGGDPALAEGQLAIGDGSGILSALALGDEGQVVTADVNGMATWDDPPAGGSGGPNAPIWLPWWIYSSSQGSGWKHTSNVGQDSFGYSITTSSAQNDYLEWTLWLEPGTYDVTFYYVKSQSSAIGTVVLDGSTLGTFDSYNGTNQYNQKAAFTGNVVASAGAKLLRVTAATRNGSANGWFLLMSGVLVQRTA